MKNTIGTSVSLTVFGESHGAAIGAVIDGLAPGIPVDEEFISAQLSKRRPSGKISTSRVEQDRFSILRKHQKLRLHRRPEACPPRPRRLHREFKVSRL